MHVLVLMRSVIQDQNPDIPAGLLIRFESFKSFERCQVCDLWNCSLHATRALPSCNGRVYFRHHWRAVGLKPLRHRRLVPLLHF